MDHKSLLKSASTISAFTMLSRFFGFLRDVVIAHFFGTGVSAQAFFVAFKIPNMLRTLMGEGAGSAAFVPVFSETLARKGRGEFLKLVNTTFFLLLGFSCVVAVLGVVSSPFLVRLIAPGFLQDSQKFALTVRLTRLLFPYLVLVTVAAYFMSVAHTLKFFAAGAASSAVFNVVLILGLFCLSGIFGVEPIYGLCAAVLLGGLAQVFVQWPSLRRRGVNFKDGGFFRHPWQEAALRKIGRLTLPRVMGAGVHQLNILVDTIFASMSFFVGEGAVAAIYYANRVIQFPLAVFGLSIVNVALPKMSEDFASGDLGRLRATFSFSLRAILLAIAPVSAGILVLCPVIVRVIFERGQFGAASSAITSQAVFFYCLGLVFYAGVRIMTHSFYALQDTRTPVKTAGAAFLVNIVLNALFIFVFGLKIAGLALASSLSAVIHFCLLWRLLRGRIGFSFGRSFVLFCLKVAAASLLMAVVVFFVSTGGAAPLVSFSRLIGVILLGAVSYLFFLRLLRLEELKEVWSWLRGVR